MVRSSASETPARAAMSAKPTCSIGCSPKSAMKASTIRSRSDAPSGDCGRVDAGRLGMRAMAASSSLLLR
jgi:hypothetical protein